MRVFVSSTYQDLVAHRRTVEDSLALSGIDYNGMEHFGSSTRPPLETCLDAVRRSDLFVGILGVRYGASPPGGRLSYTEREYRLARSIGHPILMFLIDERNASVTPESLTGETSEQQRRRLASSAFVRRHHTVTFFTSPEDLARLVLASLIREIGSSFR